MLPSAVTIVEGLLARSRERWASIQMISQDSAADEAPDLVRQYQQIVTELSEALGQPVFSGDIERLTGPHEFKALHGDFGRAWLISWWKTDLYVLVAMLTQHDAGTLNFLELEVLEKSVMTPGSPPR